MTGIKALLAYRSESLMPRLIPLVLAMVTTALVAGCQIGAPGGGARGGADADVTPNAVTGDPIEVTALDAPPAAAAVQAGAFAEAPEAQPATSAPPQDAAPAAAVDTAATPAPAPEAAPAVQKSERQIACEKKGGNWSGADGSVLRTCVFLTRDPGKQCDQDSDCEGQCLARSRTCSPLEPLLGCNDVLQDNGARVTLCIE
jgi:hypothetical protein